MRLLRQQRKPACLRAVKRSIVGCIDEIRVILAKTTSSTPPAPQPQPRRRRRVKKVTFKAQRPKFFKNFNFDTMKCVQMASDLASCVIHSGYVDQLDQFAKLCIRAFLLIRLMLNSFVWSFEVCSGPAPAWGSQPAIPYPKSTSTKSKRASRAVTTQSQPVKSMKVCIVSRTLDSFSALAANRVIQPYAPSTHSNAYSPCRQSPPSILYD